MRLAAVVPLLLAACQSPDPGPSGSARSFLAAAAPPTAAAALPAGAAAAPIAAAAAAPPAANSLVLRVLDVGPGLACIARIPGEDGPHFLVYDAGHWNTDDFVLAELQELMGDEDVVDLMVLSHSDSDHLGAVDEICDEFTVRRIIHSGMERTTDTWRDADASITAERTDEGCVAIFLTTRYLTGARSA